MNKIKESNTEFDSKLEWGLFDEFTLDAIPRKVGELIAALNTENDEQAITITELEVDLDERDAQIEKLKAEIKELKGGKTR